MNGRVRVQTIVPRELIVDQLGGFWRRVLPRFKPLTITLAAFDGTIQQANEINQLCQRFNIDGVLFASFDGQIPVN